MDPINVGMNHCDCSEKTKNAYVPGRSEVDVVGNKKCLDDLRLPDYLHGTANQ